jgi:predicted ATP-dependent endonuclease of OLD family
MPPFDKSFPEPWLTEESLDSFFARSVENLWSRYSAQVLRAVRTAQEQGLASILRVVLSTESANRRRRKSKLTPKTAYARVQNFLQRQGSASILGTQSAFEKRYINDPTLQDVVQDIDSVEDKIEVAMTSRNKLQELITRMFAGNKEIRFAEESIEIYTLSGDKIGLISLSSGEKHLLRIFVQTLLVGESAMMIDEPELSMHVDWQKDLIHSLRALNRNTQLIFATHSPEIMADVPDDKIFRI